MKNNKINNSQCPAVKDLLSGIIDNEGDRVEVSETIDHLRNCELCSAIVREYTVTGSFLQNYKRETVSLSPAFTAEVMDSISGTGYGEILDDILGLSKKAVVAFTLLVIILFGITLFPENGVIDIYTIEGIIIENGVAGEVLIKDELTYDDVVSLALTQR